MALSAFDDKSRPPTNGDLSDVLGAAFPVWNDLESRIVAQFRGASAVWAYSGKSTGWGLRLVHKDRIILYMTPCRGYFLVSFVLGERAVKAAHQSDLPPGVLRAIDGAKRYAEGTGVRFEIRDRRDLDAMETLVRLKTAGSTR
jgi:hypothetical protein